MQYLETDTDPSGPYWGEKEQTASSPVSLIIETTLSHDSGILASG